MEKRNSSQGSEIVKASLHLNEVAKNTQRRMQSAKAREAVKQSSKKQEDDKHSELLKNLVEEEMTSGQEDEYF